jgi:hypothetical protein
MAERWAGTLVVSNGASVKVSFQAYYRTATIGREIGQWEFETAVK